jgi:hypothetical protein
MGGRKRIYDNLDALARKERVKRWLDGLTEGDSRRHALYSLNRYVLWREARGLESDPDRWVEECIDGANRTLIAHLTVILDYVRSDVFEGDKNETRRKDYFRLRGLYEANMVPLPRVRLKLPNEPGRQVQASKTAISFLEIVRKVLSTGRLMVRDRSVILTLLQGAMDASSLAEVWNYVAFQQLSDHFDTPDYTRWNPEMCPARVDLVRPKANNIGLYVFLDVDGLEALKDWLSFRIRVYGSIKVYPPLRPSDLPRSDPIYVNNHGAPLEADDIGNIFRNSGKRAGVNSHAGPKPPDFKGARLRYPFYAHRVRHTLKTLAVGLADPIVVDFLMGHTADPLHYDTTSPWEKPDYYKEQYLRIARPLLNPVSGRVIEVKQAETVKIDELQKWVESQLEGIRKQLNSFSLPPAQPQPSERPASNATRPQTP